MTDPHDDDPSRQIARLIDGADFSTAPHDDAPHPAEGGSPPWAGEDDVEPADDERPADAADVSRDVLEICAHQPQNDTGNGQRLLAHFGDRLLNVRDSGWHQWTGTHWEREGGKDAATLLAQKTAERIVLEADVMAATPNEQRMIDAARDALDAMDAIKHDKGEVDAKKDPRWQMLSRVVEAGAEARAALKARQIARRKYAVSSGNAGKIRGMIDQAAPHKTIRVDELDGDKLAFNCQNGTLHFVYDEVPDPDASEHSAATIRRYRVDFQPHARGENISKVAPVDYDPKAKAPRFAAGIMRFQPIEPVRLFLQRYHGYALTGTTGEQCLIFNYGTGGNWKSTFIDIVSRVMGSYCATIDFASLSGEGQKSGSQASPDIARLPGARLVRASEPERNVQFKEALIKSLTGGEPMLTRHNYGDFFEFRPDFKLVLSGNHKPQISGVDEGIWRRINCVPWPVSIPKGERRPMQEVMAELWEERSGILNWLVAGALDYLNGGLRTPQEVMDATAEYRDDMDPVGNFIAMHVEAVPSLAGGKPASFVTAADLYDAFVAWGENNAVRPWKQKSFGEAMVSKGFERVKATSGMRYLHMKLKDVPRRRRSDAPPHPADEVPM